MPDPRYRAIPISDGSDDGTGENWNEVSPDAAQMWAVEDGNPEADWIVDVYQTRSEALFAAAALNAEPDNV